MCSNANCLIYLLELDFRILCFVSVFMFSSPITIIHMVILLISVQLETLLSPDEI